MLLTNRACWAAKVATNAPCAMIKGALTHCTGLPFQVTVGRHVRHNLVPANDGNISFILCEALHDVRSHI